MKKILVGIYFNDFKANNNFLKNEKYPDGRYNQYYILSNKLKEKNIILEIVDTKRIHSYKSIIFVGVQNYNSKKSSSILKLNKNFFLIIEECEAVTGIDYDKINFNKFNEIFNITDKKIRQVETIKIFDCSYNYKKIKFNIYKKKLICCVAANKKSSHKNEIYSERLKIIKWLSKNAPNDADLFGFGWHRYVFPINNSFFKIFNSRYFDFFFSFFFTSPQIWKGVTNDKYLTINQYKFTLAFENAKNYPGYIMEKILDCFFSSTVPIYYGASDIEKYIPKNCFIDYRDFNDPKKLYKYINSISNDKYMGYINNADKFIKSRDFKIFSHENYSEIFANTINKYN